MERRNGYTVGQPPKYLGYEDDLHKVVGISDETEKNGAIKYLCECKKCGEIHLRGSKHLRQQIQYQKCSEYKPPNWTGVENKKDNVFRRQYGITLQEARELMEFQNNECAICSSELSFEDARGFYVDHCHTTGEVRGLLCCGCNTGLGQLGDNKKALKQVLYYLENTPYSEFKYSLGV